MWDVIVFIPDHCLFLFILHFLLDKNMHAVLKGKKLAFHLVIVKAIFFNHWYIPEFQA